MKKSIVSLFLLSIVIISAFSVSSSFAAKRNSDKVTVDTSKNFRELDNSLNLLSTPLNFIDSSFEFYEGRSAYFKHTTSHKNPYTGFRAIQWNKGWFHAKNEWESWKSIIDKYEKH